jgi:hypothetical protein
VSDPTILSGSSLNTWNECPKEWEYTYLWRLERPPSYKMALGTAAHYAVEVAMKWHMEHGSYPERDMWISAFEASWSIETQDSKPRNAKPEEQAGPHLDSGIRCIEIAPTILPYRVEMPIRFTINGWVWTGTADLLEDTSRDVDGVPELHICLRDHKFSSKRPDNPRRYKWPMIGYAIGLRKDLGIIEDDVWLDYVIRNKKPIHFPVKNGGPISDEDILELAQEIENSMTAINKGMFPPLGRETGACNWCPYWDICPSYNGRRKRETAETFGVRPD